MGARNGVGRIILNDLIDAGIPVRASSRAPEASEFPDGVGVVAADLTDKASLEIAFDGMRQAFLLANHEGVADVIDAARATGVQRIVLLSSGSVIHPSSRGNKITEEHREVEDTFAEVEGLEVVPIRPLVLATNALGWAYPIKATGSVSLYRPDALTAPIHERDVAAVAVRALLSSDDVSGLLTGSQRLSQRDQVAAISSVIGRPIDVIEQSRDDAFANLSRYMPGWEAEAILQFLDDADAGNSLSTPEVEAILGRPAATFEQWAVDHADDFR